MKHGYSVSQVRVGALCSYSSLKIAKECVARLLARDSSQTEMEDVWARRCVWYALLFHRLIEAIPPGVVVDVRVLIQRCMAEVDPEDCRVAWLPHTHHLFPDQFKVSTYSPLSACVMIDVVHCKSCVMTFLLCAKSVCKTMPRDIRQMIIARLAGAEMRATRVDYSVGE